MPVLDHSRSALTRNAFTIVKEIARHILRRPVVGVAAAARTVDGRWLLVRRADVGAWALPGGTLEWGETFGECVGRELREEAGVEAVEVVRLVGVFSGFDRDPRFHAVTVLVECRIAVPSRAPSNPLEIREARLFAPADLPKELAMGMSDMLQTVLDGKGPVFD